MVCVGFRWKRRRWDDFIIMYCRPMVLTGKDVVDPIKVIQADAVVHTRYPTFARAEKRVGESYYLQWVANDRSRLSLSLRTSRPYTQSTLLLSSPHPSIFCSARAVASISTYRHSFVGICSTKSFSFCLKIRFKSASLVQSVGEHATTKLTSSHLPASSKRLDMSSARQ